MALKEGESEERIKNKTKEWMNAMLNERKNYGTTEKKWHNCHTLWNQGDRKKDDERVCPKASFVAFLLTTFLICLHEKTRVAVETKKRERGR